MVKTHNDVVILGGGITGLSAAAVLKSKATVFEKQGTPGGLVRSHCFNGGYWFDHVLHIFHCNQPEILSRLQRLLKLNLVECPPIAWIETECGRVRYPFQLNLGGLTKNAAIKCLKDFLLAYFNKNKQIEESSYKEFLIGTFGESMCKLFYFPYNEKLWKYPLNKISTNGQLWNLHQPSLEEILEGVLNPNVYRKSYNTNAFYPHPPKDSKLRGMGVLTNALAKHVPNLHLNSEVIQINPKKQSLLINKDGIIAEHQYAVSCFSTIPLPALIKNCTEVPKRLINEMKKLKWNKVLSVALSILGPRPTGIGHWRYYTDPAVPFSRLIFMTEFDKYNAPKNGWGVLAEITLPADERPNQVLMERNIICCLRKLKIIDNEQQVIGTHSWIADPAYVIFTREAENTINYALEYMEKRNITCSGRYGQWEYSSMSKNIQDGFNYADKIIKK